MEITSTAFAAGIASALLYLVFAWPLAKAFSYGRVIFYSFQMKLLAALVIGVAGAPLGERYAPYLRDRAADLIAQSETARAVYTQIASMLG